MIFCRLLSLHQRKRGRHFPKQQSQETKLEMEFWPLQTAVDGYLFMCCSGGVIFKLQYQKRLPNGAEKWHPNRPLANCCPNNKPRPYKRPYKRPCDPLTIRFYLHFHYLWDGLYITHPPIITTGRPVDQQIGVHGQPVNFYDPFIHKERKFLTRPPRTFRVGTETSSKNYFCREP